jgi:hypothetical protein
MEMKLPDLRMVLANEAFPKGSPRPDSFSFRNKPRHRQAGCKSFRAETFEAELAHAPQALFDDYFAMSTEVTHNIAS